MVDCLEQSLRIGWIWQYYIPPDENEVRGQIEYHKEQGDKAPRRRPGDWYPIVGALLGVIAGSLLSIRTGNFVIVALCAAGGGIAGAVIGSFIGSLVMKYQKSRRDREQSIF